jgi:hypothetical protein
MPPQPAGNGLRATENRRTERRPEARATRASTRNEANRKHGSSGYIGSQSSRGEATEDTSGGDSVRQRRIKEK